MKAQKTMTVSFQIPCEDYERFEILEAIALTTDQKYLKFLRALVSHLEGRRKRTPEEIHQRAVIWEVDDEDIIK